MSEPSNAMLLDVWQALGGNYRGFAEWIVGRSRADAWAQLMAWVRRDPPIEDTNPPAGPHPRETL